MDERDKLVESVELLAELLPPGTHVAVIDGQEAPLVRVREALNHGQAVEIIQQQKRWLGFTAGMQVAAAQAHPGRSPIDAVREFEIRLRMHVQAVNASLHSWGW
jgi:hypothetical protein